MSMCPTWRAVSSIRWNTAQRNVVGRRSPREGRSSEVTCSRTMSATCSPPGRTPRPPRRPSPREVEHVGPPGHVHRLAGAMARSQSRSRVAEVDDQDARASWPCGAGRQRSWRRIQALDLEDGALAQVLEPGPGHGHLVERLGLRPAAARAASAVSRAPASPASGLTGRLTVAGSSSRFRRRPTCTSWRWSCRRSPASGSCPASRRTPGGWSRWWSSGSPSGVA